MNNNNLIIKCIENKIKNLRSTSSGVSLIVHCLQVKIKCKVYFILQTKNVRISYVKDAI